MKKWFYFYIFVSTKQAHFLRSTPVFGVRKKIRAVGVRRSRNVSSACLTQSILFEFFGAKPIVQFVE